MQKLSVDVLEKMVGQQLTGCEIDFLLYISRYQDECGRVRGVYYKDAAGEMKFSHQQFYNVKKSLQAKGLIAVEKNNYYDHDITILDNSYEGITDLKKKPYVNTNHDIFFSEDFRKMKPSAKLMALVFMARTRANASKKLKPYIIGDKNLFETYTKMLGVTKRVIRRYLTSLRKFFDIRLAGKNYEIVPLSRLFASAVRKTEETNFNEHEVSVMCHRNRVSVKEEQELVDTAYFLKQYGDIAKEAGRDLRRTLEECIEKSVQKGRESFTSRKKELKAKLIHVWLRALLGVDTKTE